MCWSLSDTVCMCHLKYLYWIVLSCSVSQKPSRQAPPTGPQSGDSLWMGVLCVPTGVLGVPTGVLGGYVVRTSHNVLFVADVVCNSEGVYTYSDVCTPHFADYWRLGGQWMIL